MTTSKCPFAAAASSELFAALDNLYWGLWALNQAQTEGCEEFPYLLYCANRFQRGLADAQKF